MKTTKKATKKATKRVIAIKCMPMADFDPKYIGKTIKQVREMAKDNLELSENQPVSLSKDGGWTYGEVGELYHVRKGDIVEFSRAPGTKCHITECTGCGRKHCLEHGDCV